MKEELIKAYNFRPKANTKWNEIFENSDYILIYNKVTREIKIKEKV